MSYSDYVKTDVERLALNAWLEHGSIKKASKALGKSKTAVQEAVKRVKDRASLQGYCPEKDMTHTAPDTHIVKGTSTLYKDGEVVLQWVKTDKKLEDQQKVITATAKALAEDIKPRTIYKYNPVVNKSLANVFVITDYHLGMMAWHEETRDEDWDMEIAEESLLKWFEQAIEQSPAADTAILSQIGDFMHWDGMDAVTPSHGHVLDADTRFQKLVRVAIRCFVKITDMLLQKHNKVHIIHATGNHDLASSVWLRELFSHYYSSDSRVTVDNSADCYYCYEHGKTSLFFHHGHRRKPSNISSVFAGKFRDIFGRTRFSYGHMGHLHSKDVKEDSLMVIEQHQTLAASDAYASSGGWLSQRSAQCITYHKDYGEVSRIRITPEMIK